MISLSLFIHCVFYLRIRRNNSICQFNFPYCINNSIYYVVVSIHNFTDYLRRMAFGFTKTWAAYGSMINDTQEAFNALRVEYNKAFRVFSGLLRYCNASGIFAKEHTYSFYAIRRKQIASLLSCGPGSHNRFWRGGS